MLLLLLTLLFSPLAGQSAATAAACIAPGVSCVVDVADEFSMHGIVCMLCL